MRTVSLAAFAAVALCAPAALTQATWNQLTPTNSPPARAGSTGASLGVAFMLFGGNSGVNSIMRNDVWSFDGTNWANLTPAAGPAPIARDWHGCCWDNTNQRLLVFGGRDGGNLDLGDTWTFDGSSWTQHNLAIAPSPRRWATMQFDPIRGNVILFGGYDIVANQFFNDTWSWNGSSWSLLSPATAPSPRGRGHLAWYPPTQELMHFGGRTATSGGIIGETWMFNGSTWRQQTTATIPGPTNQGLIAGAMSYDEYRDRMVLFGGTYSGPVLNTSWEFDGVDWRNRGNLGGITSRTFPSMAYLSSTRSTYLFGGFISAAQSDTWEYKSITPASVAISGTGCAGTSGVLTMSSTGTPWTGGNFTVGVSNVGSAPTFLAIGFSNTSWNGIPLPLPMALLNAPGCTLYTEIQTTVGLSPIGGVAAFFASVPADPSLNQATVHFQGLAIDPTANGLGVVFSNLASATIGSR